MTTTPIFTPIAGNSAVGRFASRITQGWLAEMQAANHWAALMTGDPTVTSDPLSVEQLGGSYFRPQVYFEWVGQILRNSTAMNWLSLPPQSRIVGVAGFDAAYNGNLVWWCPLDEPLDFPTGGGWGVAAGDLFLGVD